MKKINKLVKLSLSALLLITLIPASITAETDPAIETGGSTQVDPNKDTAAGDGQFSGNINWNDDGPDDPVDPDPIDPVNPDAPETGNSNNTDLITKGDVKDLGADNNDIIDDDEDQIIGGGAPIIEDDQESESPLPSFTEEYVCSGNSPNIVCYTEITYHRNAYAGEDLDNFPIDLSSADSLASVPAQLNVLETRVFLGYIYEILESASFYNSMPYVSPLVESKLSVFGNVMRQYYESLDENYVADSDIFLATVLSRLSNMPIEATWDEIVYVIAELYPENYEDILSKLLYLSVNGIVPSSLAEFVYEIKETDQATYCSLEIDDSITRPYCGVMSTPSSAYFGDAIEDPDVIPVWDDDYYYFLGRLNYHKTELDANKEYEIKITLLKDHSEGNLSLLNDTLNKKPSNVTVILDQNGFEVTGTNIDRILSYFDEIINAPEQDPDDPTVNPGPVVVPTEDERKETYINVELSDVYCDNTDFTSFCVVTNEDLLDTYKADLEAAADKVLIKKNGEKEFTSKEALDDVYVISYKDSKDLTGLVYGTKKIVVETSYGSVILPANHLYVFDGTKTRTNYLDVAMNYSQIVLGDRTKLSMTGSVIDASRLDEVVDYEFNENTAYEVYVVSESTDETDSQKKLINAASKIESKEDYNVKLDDHVLFELSIAAKSLDLEALEVKEDTDIKMKSDSYLHLNVTKPYGLFKTDEGKHFMNNMYHILDEATNSVEKVELPIYTSDAYYDIAITSMSPYVYVYKGYKAQYKFLSADSNVLPEGIETLVEDENMYVENEEIYPVLPSKTIVNTNDGVWEFKGYDIEKTIASGKGIVPFVGTWKYTETPTYTVTWVDDNGTVLEKDEKVKKDTWPTYDSKTPSKASTKQYIYTFLGWDKELSPVTQDVTYTAVYKKTAVKYKVTFVDDDGSILKAPTEYEYGTKAANIAQPSTPKKASDGKYTYTFAGWDKKIVDVTADAVYTATYKKTKIENNSRTEADVYYSNVAPKMGDC